MSRRAAIRGSFIVALVWSALAAGCPVAGAHAGKLADSGFRPAANGFAFANYGVAPGIPNLGPQELQMLFGPAVCASGTGTSCVLTPPALAWMQTQNAEMADGHCLGFSITALLFRAGLLPPSTFGAASVPRLSIKGNDLLAREIAYAWTFQLLPSVRDAEIHGSPNAILAAVESDLRTGSELDTLAITQPDGSGGHAVTPYEVQRESDGMDAILVYDNNYPDTTRTVTVDTLKDTWSFVAAKTAGAPSSLYRGNAATDSLFLVPTRPGLGVQPCPFCATLTEAAPGAPIAATESRFALAAAAPRVRDETIRLQTRGRTRARLLITGPHGARLGFVGRHLVDRIRGARVIHLLSGSPHTWLDGPQDEFQVPAGQRYRIQLTGVGSRDRRGHRRRRAHSVAAGSEATVTVLGPGSVAAVRSIRYRPGTRDDVGVPASGTAVTFDPAGGASGAAELVVGDSQPGAVDHEWNVVERHTPRSQPVSAELDGPHQTVSIVGGGTYDVALDTVGRSVSVFGHNRVTLPHRATATLDYAGAAAGQALPLTTTIGGRVMSTALLGDEPSTFDPGTEFTPPEPGPALPVIDDGDDGGGDDGTSTTVDCSPDPVAVGAPADCTADVATDDGLAADGVVTFSAAGGSLSSAACTLADGSCAVTFTPSDTGSDSEEVDATYGGDDDHVASSGSTSLGIDTGPGDAGLDATATTLACDPADVAVGDSTSCTATVTDTSAAPTPPTGAVTFSSDDPLGAFPGGDSCALMSADGASATCTVTYVAGSDGNASDTVAASYGGDAGHEPS